MIWLEREFIEFIEGSTNISDFSNDTIDVILSKVVDIIAYYLGEVV